MTTRNYQDEIHLTTLFWIALSCVGMGGMLGASTNAINGMVSPIYYQNILGWEFSDILTASIAQGIFEGVLYGVFFAIFFVSGLVIITKGRATYFFALKQLLKILAVVYGCWIIGGLIALGLAAISPDRYHKMFRMVPDNFREMLGYAWVGGSIWGALLGSVLALVLGIFNMSISWKRISPNK